MFLKRIEAEKANILFNDWDMKNIKKYLILMKKYTIENKESLVFSSFYNVEKLNNLLKI